MNGQDHELIYKALCSSIREHEKLIKDKDGIIKSWYVAYAEETAAKNNFRNLYYEAIEAKNIEKERFQALQLKISQLESEVDFWRSKHLTRVPDRRPDVPVHHAEEKSV